MNLAMVLSLLDGEVLSRQADLEHTFAVGFGADLMSDVLAFAPAGALLLTGLVNPQVVRTAEMAGIGAIVLVRAKEPPAETVRLAEEVGIAVLATRYTLYEACGRLYAAGLAGIGLLPSYDIRRDVPGERAERSAG